MQPWNALVWSATILLIALLEGCDVTEEAPNSASHNLSSLPRQEFTLAVLPYISPPHLFDAFSPLASYLEDEIGKTVRIHTAIDFNEFMRSTLAERYDLVVSNPFLYLTLRKQGGYEPIVADSRPFESALVVPAESMVTEIADLKGKRIGVLPEKALAGHLLPVDLLKSAGLHKNRDYTAVVMPTFDVILTALLNGEVAAGAIWLSQYEDYSAETKSRTRLLATTDRYAGDPYAVRGDLPKGLREAVQSALLRLNEYPERKQLFKAIGVQRFVLADDADYDSMREFAERNQLDY